MGCGVSVDAANNSSARTNKKRYIQSFARQKSNVHRHIPLTSGEDFIVQRDVKEWEVKILKEKLKLEFEKDALEAHNEYRALHGVPALKLCKTLTEHAQSWADQIAQKDMMIHSSCVLENEEQIGENIYTCWSSCADAKAVGRDAVRSWYEESITYDYAKATFSYKTGHFTQVIWKETTMFGTAWAKSKHDTIYVVANYRPAGNVHGEFQNNVLRPLNYHTNTVNNEEVGKEFDSDENEITGV